MEENTDICEHSESAEFVSEKWQPKVRYRESRNLRGKHKNIMYYDLLPKIKNAVRARKEFFQTSYSNLDLAVAKLLVEEGFLKSASKKEVGKKQYLEIKPAFKSGDAVFTDYKLFSKPSRRMYRGYDELKPVRQGYGISIVTTPKGVLTGKQAKKEKVGGEYLCEVW